MLDLLAIVRLHTVFHINNLKPFSTTSLRPAIMFTTREDEGDELDVFSHP
jgi:hypothetical protein